MRYVLINDTSGTNNPGCQDTVRSLTDLYAQYGHHVGATIPVGAGHGHFVACAEKFQAHCQPGPAAELSAADAKRGPLANVAATIARGWPKALQRRRPRARTAANESFHSAVEIVLQSHQSQLAACDHVVINGEGTLHHDRPGAFALLGWAYAAKRLGKHVALVNCTIESFGPAFWDLLPPAVDYLAVREPNSHRYVQPHFPGVQQAADAIFGSWGASSGFHPTRRRAGYSPGVLSYEGIVTADSVREHLGGLRQAFDEVVFYTAEVEDQVFEPVAAELGCHVEPLGALTSENAVEQMQQLSILVSGRYHLCIFALLAGTPFVPLQSNTWKMDGLLALSQRRFARLPLGHAGPLPDLSALALSASRRSTPASPGRSSPAEASGPAADRSERTAVFPEDFDLAHLKRLANLNVPDRFRSRIRGHHPRGSKRLAMTSPVAQ